MKTYVAEINGEPILAFRAEDDEAAERIIHEQDGGFQIVVRGYSAFFVPTVAPCGTGLVQSRSAWH